MKIKGTIKYQYIWYHPNCIMMDALTFQRRFVVDLPFNCNLLSTITFPACLILHKSNISIQILIEIYIYLDNLWEDKESAYYSVNRNKTSLKTIKSCIPVRQLFYNEVTGYQLSRKLCHHWD